MSSLVLKLFVQMVLVLAVSVVIASAQAPRTPPHQSADAFVGTWILNLAKSTFEGLSAPKSGMRTFDYERDGMILTTVHSEDAKGSADDLTPVLSWDGRTLFIASNRTGANGEVFFSTRKKVHGKP